MALAANGSEFPGRVQKIVTDTVGFHDFNLRIFNLRVSNPNKLIVCVFVTRCRISICQGLGPKKHDEISEIDCSSRSGEKPCRDCGKWQQIRWSRAEIRLTRFPSLDQHISRIPVYSYTSILKRMLKADIVLHRVCLVALFTSLFEPVLSEPVFRRCVNVVGVNISNNAICGCFDGILLKPCLLQPCFHVAGYCTLSL